jgi:hypothetical protein
MKTKWSESFEFDLKIIKSVIRQMIILYTPVILLFLDQIQKWTIDPKIIIALVISTTIDIIRRYLTDYSN